MKVILFGASGMVGQGVLRECLLASDVTEVVSFVRSTSGETHGKLREIVGSLDALDPAALRGAHAVFYCLGVSSAGMTDEQYRAITYDLTLSVASTIHALEPNVTFNYVSGSGTDSTGKGSSSWARVKGETENALLSLLPNAYMLRPGLIRPKHGAVSKTRLYRVSYTMLWPVLPLLQALFPKSVTDTEIVGRAMLQIARSGAPKRLLESADIVDLGRGFEK